MRANAAAFLIVVVNFMQLPSALPAACQIEDGFQCANSACTPYTFICDKEDDCGDHSDELMCSDDVTSEHEFLITADMAGRNIYQLRLGRGRIVRLLTLNLERRPAAVAFDVPRRVIYWTDIATARIVSRPLITPVYNTRPTTVYTAYGQVRMTGLALDSLRQKLYYADEGNDAKIAEISADGSRHRVVLKQRGIKPRDVVLHDESRTLYFTDCGVRPSLGAVAVNSTQPARTFVAVSSIVQPNALSLDSQERMLYWADGQLGRIERCRLDGSDRQLLYSRRGDDYRGIALSPSFIYVTDHTTRFVRKLDRRTYEMSDEPPQISGYLAGIVYHGHTASSPSTADQSDDNSRYVTSQEAGNITATSETLIAVRSGHSPPVNTALLDSTPTRVRGDFVPESTTEPQPRHQAVDYLGQDQPRTTVVDGTAVMTAVVVMCGVVLTAAVVTVGVACVCIRIKRARSEVRSFNALLTPSQRAATLRLSSSAEHQSNDYDYLHDDGSPTDLPRRSYYDRPSTSSAAACCDDEYLTPVTCSDYSTTSTVERDVYLLDNGGYESLTDSGKYLQLQDTVYYEYI